MFSSKDFQPRIFDAEALYSKKMTPQEFLAIPESERGDIESTRFEPPKIGDPFSGFGKFVVRYKTPRFEVQK
jgi:hypothetical protein